MQSLTSWFLADSLQILAIFWHNFAKLAPKSMKIQSKINKNDPEKRSETVSGTRSFPGRVRGKYAVNLPVPSWSHFGAQNYTEAQH